MKRFFVLAILCAALIALPALTQERPVTMDGFSPEGARAERSMGTKISRHAFSGQNARRHAASDGASSSRRLAV